MLESINRFKPYMRTFSIRVFCPSFTEYEILKFQILLFNEYYQAFS